MGTGLGWKAFFYSFNQIILLPFFVGCFWVLGRFWQPNDLEKKKKKEKKEKVFV